MLKENPMCLTIDFGGNIYFTIVLVLLFALGGLLIYYDRKALRERHRELKKLLGFEEPAKDFHINTKPLNNNKPQVNNHVVNNHGRPAPQPELPQYNR